MYKRGTFGHLALHSEVVSGRVKEDIKGIVRECENEMKMEQTKSVRTKWLTIRLSEDEEKKLLKFFRRTTAASLSEYARDVLLQEPVRVLYRNQSADDFLAGMLLLKKELNAIGNNLNQAVHKLHTLDHISQIHDWVVMQEANNKIIFKKVEEIAHHMQQLYELWLQK